MVQDMETKQFKVEQLFYLTALALALLLRLLNLGLIPLSESEAGWALQAFQAANGDLTQMDGNPAYVLLTGALFYLIGSTDFLARLLPAIAGSMVILLPYALRKKIGSLPAVLFAFGLAFDPGLVMASRLAGGPMLALGFVCLANSFWLMAQPVWAGIFLGLSLLSGPAALMGWLIFAGSLAVFLALGHDNLFERQQPRKPAWLAYGATMLLAGTLFMRYPQGLSAFGTGVIDFITGFGRFSGVPLVHMLIALPVYQSLGLLFGLGALAWKWKPAQPVLRFFKIWFVVSLAVVLLYPSRQVVDLNWVALPLVGLAGLALARYLPWQKEKRTLVVWAQAGVVVTLLVLGWINLSSLSAVVPLGWPQFVDALSGFRFDQFALLDANTQIFAARMAVMVLVPVLIGLATFMVGAGWSYREAVYGLGLALALCLALLTFRSAWGAAHLRVNQVQELWYPGPVAGNGDLLIETVEDFSSRNTGFDRSIEVVSLYPADWLAWELRLYPKARFETQLADNVLPNIVISGASVIDPVLENAYVGQDFALSFARSWQGNLPQRFAFWYVFRQAPSSSEYVILWVRADLFPEGAALPDGGE